MLEGLKLFTPSVFPDERGFFFESFHPRMDLGPFPQDNISFSHKDTIRALHYQSEPGQAKLVTCLSGAIWDVAVDLRPDSPTFLQYYAVELNDQNRKQLYIPIGFAHGFCALSPALVQYKVSAPYNSKTECSIRWNDPDLNIAWPTKTPLLSERDQTSPLLKELFHALDHRR